MRRRELCAHAAELGFTPRDTTRWLSPGQLARTGAKVALSAVFADYSDKREIQAALSATLLRAPGIEAAEAGVAEDDLWFDFVADLGDGFDATYTVASYLAAERLRVTSADGSEQLADLPRGSLLVMGGDEVYPTASARDYEDRTIGPYKAALPAADDAPMLVVLPGNHDWYDGLTSFLRIFTQGRAVGGWRTAQTRSYYALQLPRRWWLVALDSQFGTYIDQPQLEYFEEHVTRHLQPGDAIIISAATPTWVHTAEDNRAAFDALHWFDLNYLSGRRVPGSDEAEDTGATVRLWITGDSHHYARYAEELPGAADDSLDDTHRRQMVTCGLGGAYLSATHTLPERLAIPPEESRVRRKDRPSAPFLKVQATYPDRADSRAMSRRLAMPWRPEWLPRRNRGFPELAAGVHVLGFFLLSFVFGLVVGREPVPAVRTAGLDAFGTFVWEVVLGLALALLVGWLCKALRQHRAVAPPSTWGLAVVLQVACSLLVLLLALAIPWPAGWPNVLVLASCLVLAAVVGATVGSEAFALFILTARTGRVEDWQMAGQAVEDHKGFIRMTINGDADLVLYPLVIDTICRDWDIVDEGDGVRRPRPATPLPAARLVEPKITISRGGRPR